MASGSQMTDADLRRIGEIIGHSNLASIKEIIRNPNRIQTWTVAQCKDVIRHFREKWPEHAHRFTLTGRKSDLVAAVAAVLTFNPKALVPGYHHHYRGFHTPQVDVPALIDHAKFKGNRCPFIIDWQNLTAVAIVPSNQSAFKFLLTSDQVAELRKARNDRTLGLHLRLFSQAGHHEMWDVVAASGINVYINKEFITISGTKSKAGTKKRGHHVAKPLDVSAKAQESMEVEIHCQANFTGICVAELASFHTTDQMIQSVLRRCRGVSAAEKKCEICNKKKDLMRCSRCKTAWYCSGAHQQQHWSFHQRLCKPYRSRPKLPKPGGDHVDDDIFVGESRVSLNCPLTIKRISIPVRGTSCHHPQCFDLRGYLRYCCVTGNWQCPVCTNPCQFKDLGIDEQMEKILKETDKEIDQVRLFPDGKIEPITLEEIRREHANFNSVKNNRKRKRVAEPPISGEPPKKKTGGFDAPIVLD